MTLRDLVQAAGGAWPDEFALEDGDRVFVRTLPGYVPPATVMLAISRF